MFFFTNLINKYNNIAILSSFPLIDTSKLININKLSQTDSQIIPNFSRLFDYCKGNFFSNVKDESTIIIESCPEFLLVGLQHSKNIDTLTLLASVPSMFLTDEFFSNDLKEKYYLSGYIFHLAHQIIFLNHENGQWLLTTISSSSKINFFSAIKECLTNN